MFSLRVMVLVLLASLIAPTRAPAATFVVDRTDDTAAASACSAAGNDCSLRGAIVNANALGGTNTVSVPAGTYVLTVMGANENAAATGDLDVTGGTLSITGAGAASTILDGNLTDRVLQVVAPATVTVAGVTITRGKAQPEGAFSYCFGGGVANGGTLTIHDAVVSNNNAGDAVGCLNNSGGGIASGVFTASTLTIVDTTISGNAGAHLFGGGIALGGTEAVGASATTATISNSTINGNLAASGGGLLNLSGGAGTTATITNSTVSGNGASSEGGGITNWVKGEPPVMNAVLNLNNVTITQNSASGSGGGLRNVSGAASAVVNVSNTIVAGNTGGAAPDCAAAAGPDAITGRGYVLLQNASGCNFSGASDLTGNVVAPPTLGPLQDNGGPTATHEVLAGSPAINAGSPAPGGTYACAATDQRGLVRPTGVPPRCDIGAFEFGCFDSDGDGICNPSDNCPAAVNPDQRNGDGQDGGDVCDACALDSIDACSPDQSGAGPIPPGGGSVPTSPTGPTLTCPAGARCGSCSDAAKSACAVDADCPAGTACGPTSFSITGGDVSFYGLGNTSGNLVGGIATFGPSGQSFNADALGHPEHNVRIAFRWLDGDNNGFVNSRSNPSQNTSIQETSLKAWRNANALSTCGGAIHVLCSSDLPCPPGAGSCGNGKTCANVAQASCPTGGAIGVSALCCETTTNIWVIMTSTFSEYALGLDACDPITAPALKLTKIAAPAGDDTLAFKGALTLTAPTAVADLDPLVHGLKLALVDDPGPLFDLPIPSTAYDPVAKVGWKVNGKGTKWTYVDKSAVPPSGIVQVVLSDRSAKAPGLVQIAVKGKNGNYAATPALTMTVVLPDAARCFTAAFPGPAPDPLCTVKSGGSTLSCR